MRRYGCAKRNPDPKWPYEQAVIAVPPGSQRANEAGQNGTLKVLENPETTKNESPEIEMPSREDNMPIMGFMQEREIRGGKSFENLKTPLCPKEDVFSYLCPKMGSFARVEFLFGENTHVEKSGILKSVGKDFVVLTEMGSGTEVVCSSKHIKFINIYRLNNG